MGDKAFWYGKHLTEDTKKKLSESHKGKCKYWLGKKRNKQTIEKIIAKRKGKNRGKNNVSSKPILCIDTNVLYESIGEASRILNISRTGIMNCLKRTTKTSGGYKWYYYVK